MMPVWKSIPRFLLVACLVTAAAYASAQDKGYSRINVKGRVQVELPVGWSISDGEQRKRVAEFGGALMDKPDVHVASLAAQSYPAPSRTMLRVSLIDLDPPLTQAEVRAEWQQRGRAAVQELADWWSEESKAMWANMSKVGVTQVGSPTVGFEQVAGQLAMYISYGRTIPGNTTETMRVTQYHIPMGVDKALITISHIEGDANAKAAADRIKRSLVAKPR